MESIRAGSKGEEEGRWTPLTGTAHNRQAVALNEETEQGGDV
jgi:hypothetical protein